MQPNTYIQVALMVLFVPGGLTEVNLVNNLTLRACIWHDVEISTPYDIQWDVQTLVGHPGCTFPMLSSPLTHVDKAGLTCTDIGQVAVDLECIFVPTNTTYSVSYTSVDEGVYYSGSTELDYIYGYFLISSSSTMSLENASPGTSICSSKAHCVNKNVTWDEFPRDLWVVFAPGTVGSLVQDGGDLTGVNGTTAAPTSQLLEAA